MQWSSMMVDFRFRYLAKHLMNLMFIRFLDEVYPWQKSNVHQRTKLRPPSRSTPVFLFDLPKTPCYPNEINGKHVDLVRVVLKLASLTTHRHDWTDSSGSGGCGWKRSPQWLVGMVNKRWVFADETWIKLGQPTGHFSGAHFGAPILGRERSTVYIFNCCAWAQGWPGKLMPWTMMVMMMNHQTHD